MAIFTISNISFIKSSLLFTYILEILIFLSFEYYFIISSYSGYNYDFYISISFVLFNIAMSFFIIFYKKISN